MLANAVLEKFGGDTMAETRRRPARYAAALDARLEPAVRGPPDAAAHRQVPAASGAARQGPRRSPAFDGSLQQLIDDMIETMYAAPGIGLAAPQVGVPLRVCVIDSQRRPRQGGEVITLVNPEFVEREGMQLEDEGCLSVPGFTATVARPVRAVVRALDRHGQPDEPSRAPACSPARCSTNSTTSTARCSSTAFAGSSAI